MLVFQATEPMRRLLLIEDAKRFITCNLIFRLITNYIKKHFHAKDINYDVNDINYDYQLSDDMQIIKF